MEHEGGGIQPIMEPEQFAKMLGLPLFQTPFFLPDYPVGEWGNWRMSHMGMGFDHGYHTRQWVVSGMPVLLRRNARNREIWDTWMSLTPHEIESQEAGCLYARGHTVIMGLGMGWIALNAALNPAVNRITVVELDPDVIDLFNATGVSTQVAPEIRTKIEIVHGDALKWRPQVPVDFLFADIWRDIAEPNALAETRRMQEQVCAEQLYFWGQELALHAAFQRLFGANAEITLARLEQCLEQEIRLPLLLPRDIDYADRIATVVRNRRDRLPPSA